MAVVYGVAILLLLSSSPGAERVLGHQPPCHQCDAFRDSSPLQELRTHCTYPCECENQVPICALGVSVTRDGCGCCPICARQLGEACDKTSVCDERRGIYCHYPFVGATIGICQGVQGHPCTVANTTYHHGETFHVDCRTQCTCQNGTYACSTLCPNENISPRGACEHPRLVEVPDQCCREWMCDSTEAEHPPTCKQEFTSWSDCSAQCGLGLSHRVSNVNGCVLQNETRICQLRPCEAGMLAAEDHARHHHIRKGHECKATQRVAGPVRLHFGPCRSRKRYRPKFCGHCADRPYEGCCSPQLSTTIPVEFICDVLPGEEDSPDLLLDLIEPGRDLWWPDDLLALKTDVALPLTTSKAKEPFKFLHSNAFMNNLDWPLNKSKFGRSYGDPIISTKANGRYGEEPTIYHLGRHLTTTDESYQITSTEKTTDVTPEMAITPNPNKKKRKKTHKPYTSWLEFRDEEYEMDEYDDYEDNKQRRRRSLFNDRQKKTAKKRKRRHASSSESKKDKIKLEMKGRRYYEARSLSQDPCEVNIKKSKLHQSTPSPQRFEQRNFKGDKIKKIAKALASSQREEGHREVTGAEKHNKDSPKRKHKNNTIVEVKHHGEGVPGQKVNISSYVENSSRGKFYRLSKMERIIQGRTPSANLTRLWWTQGKVSSRPHKARKKRSASRPRWALNTKPDSSGGHTVSFNVQWIVKCACDHSCGLTTTTPSELTGDGETLLRRVHRTSPP